MAGTKLSEKIRMAGGWAITHWIQLSIEHHSHPPRLTNLGQQLFNDSTLIHTSETEIEPGIAVGKALMIKS